ncbi:DUF2313 domain-containing protein [Halobacteriovorax sp. GB3]|uniref:YmfQ family protein n=1 Tax=Halobacteriovorax sp. GB3 TaxID=2719615 RepID=UPI00235FAAD4|nr:putative phage tail protein [Halobacteriovorax sp. GB3]MDD0853003.1 DUF2313 domain-containing protein [Halobacteriovorax sp. GB3]
MAKLDEKSFLELAKSLLPPGRAWSRESGTRLEKILLACTDEFRRIKLHAYKLVNETDPSQTSEMLDDWEKLLGFPDERSGPLELLSLQARKKLVYTYYTMTGGLTPQYYIDLLKNFGFEIEIDEPRPFRCGMSSCGDGLYNGNWYRTFFVVIKDVPRLYFSAGQSVCGDPLNEPVDNLIESIINRSKPSHMKAHFSYIEGE